MAQLPSKFSTEDKGEMNNFDALPAGEYQVKVKDSSLNVNSKKTGKYLKFIFEVTEGEFKGRWLFSNMNIIHTNVQAVEKAEKELATLCRACGKSSILDSDEVHGCELMVKITQTKATSQYPAGNDIKDYQPVKGIAKPQKPDSGEKVEKKKHKVSFD